MIWNSQPWHNGKKFPYSPVHNYNKWVQLDKQYEYAITKVKLRLYGKRWAFEVSAKFDERPTHFLVITTEQEQGLKQKKSFQ